MAGAARRDVLSVRLCVSRMTAKTRDVGIQTRWNREPDTAAITTMASGTSSASVLGMIELGVETAQRRKSFDLPVLNVRVTDRANRTSLV